MTNEQKTNEKKDHPILYGVAILVIGSTAMLFVTTIYNLVLAHIWPVTIHFGEYSLANVIYIMVSVITSVIISFLAFYFAIYYFLTMIRRGILLIGSTPEQRAARKRSKLERAIDSLGYFFLLPLYFIGLWQERSKPPPVRSELTKRVLEKPQQTQSKNEDKQ